MSAMTLSVMLLAGCSAGDEGANDSPSQNATSGAAGMASAGAPAMMGGAGAKASGGAQQGGKAGAPGGVGGGSGKGGEQAGGAASFGGKGGAGGAGVPPCETNNDCVPYVPETQPASCAKATCDVAAKRCRFVARDFDGDGHGTTSCKSLDASITIELGDDCDDGDEKVYPGAWDGPEGEGHKNACDDGLDNDCDGKQDDDALSDSTGCKCVVGDKRTCSETEGGKPISYPGGSPQGECRPGAQTCIEQNGKTVWGACVGAEGPGDELCNGKDDDCDGLTDEDDALNKRDWYWDADNDGFGDASFAPVTACDPPAGPPKGCVDTPGKSSCKVGPQSWKVLIEPSDCNDTDVTAYPNAKEVCDGVDNDCDGAVDEGSIEAVTWYRDEDGDGHLNKSQIEVASKKQCERPGGAPEDCPSGATPCTLLWVKEGTAPFDDCDDGKAHVHPGAWDGPAFAPRPHGIAPPGLKLEVFKIAPSPALPPPLSELTPEPGTRTEVTINLDLGHGSLGPGLPTDFAARWTGSLVIPTEGDYTFYTLSNDGVRLWVGDLQAPLIDDWTPHAATELSATTHLAKGTYPYKVEYFDAKWSAVLVVSWEGPGFGRQPMTVTLAPTAEQQIDRCGDSIDNDCDGSFDDDVIETTGSSVLKVGCTAECDPIVTTLGVNVSRACGVGPTTGICHQGAQLCGPTGQYGPCAGEQGPEPESCDTADVDEDCDGSPTNGCDCTGNATLPCGTCGDGVQTCIAGKWDGCSDPTPNEPRWGRNADGDDNARDCTRSCGQPAGMVPVDESNKCDDLCDNSAGKSAPYCPPGNWSQTSASSCVSTQTGDTISASDLGNVCHNCGGPNAGEVWATQFYGGPLPPNGGTINVTIGMGNASGGCWTGGAIASLTECVPSGPECAEPFGDPQGYMFTHDEIAAGIKKGLSFNVQPGQTVCCHSYKTDNDWTPCGQGCCHRKVVIDWEARTGAACY